MVDTTPFVNSLVENVVSHVWRGAGSALFLEFGKLSESSKHTGKPGNPSGEITLMIEWSWRIERPRSVLGGSWSSEGRWPSMFQQLLGNRVEAVEFFGVLPEIAVSFSNSLRVVSFMTTEGQPSWSLIAHSPALGSLGVRRGRLHVEEPTPNPTLSRTRLRRAS